MDRQLDELADSRRPQPAPVHRAVVVHLEQLQRTGFAEQADSWVGRGANKPISPDAMTQIFGRDGLEQISRQAGISEDEASRGLSELLPEVVDRMTPEGEVPDPDALANSVDAFARRFGLS